MERKTNQILNMKNFSFVKHSIFKKPIHNQIINELGYCIIGNIENKKKEDLLNLYNETHDFSNSSEGGMFYSLYSNNLEYREKVHSSVAKILKPLYDDFFEDYKIVLNSFIVKVKGEKSAFTLHQDSTSLDETKFSPISLWIPLQDTDITNGCLFVIPKSHNIVFPYRGISFKSIFSSIEDTLKPYLVPIELKAGDILAFDNRLIHYSHLNQSNNDRIIAMSGIFPKNAEFQMCYKNEENNPFSPIEIYKQSDDYLLKNTLFFHNCTCSPEMGEKIKEIHLKVPVLSSIDFEILAKKFSITKFNHPALIKEADVNILSEPTL
jgi:hypothetical protein